MGLVAVLSLWPHSGRGGLTHTKNLEHCLALGTPGSSFDLPSGPEIPVPQYLGALCQAPVCACAGCDMGDTDTPLVGVPISAKCHQWLSVLWVLVEATWHVFSHCDPTTVPISQMKKPRFRVVQLLPQHLTAREQFHGVPSHWHHPLPMPTIWRTFLVSTDLQVCPPDSEKAEGMDPSLGANQLVGWLGGRCLQEVEKRLTGLSMCSFLLEESSLTKNSQPR